PFPLGPLGRVDAAAQVGQIGVRSLETKRTNVGPITTRRLPDVSQNLCHGLNPPGKTEDSERASGNGCRCSTDKLTAIEIGFLGHNAPHFTSVISGLPFSTT